MKHLFDTRRELKAAIESTILTSESKGMRRVDTFNQTRLLAKQLRDIDSRIDLARRQLAKLIIVMLRQLESHIRGSHVEESLDLIQPLQKLVNLSYEEENFPWNAIMEDLHKYRRHEGCALKAEEFIASISKLIEPPNCNEAEASATH